MNANTHRSSSLWLFLAGLLLVGVGLSAFLLYTSGSAQALPRLGAVSEAKFTSQAGSAFSLSELKGSVWVADLIFTTCSGPCLRMTSQLHRVQEEFKDQTGVRLVSISVDPARDTPERLAWYAGQTQAKPEMWVFLTADLDTVRKVATEGLKLVVDHNVEGEEQGILHSDRFVLVDTEMQIRGYYDGMDPAAFDSLRRDIRALVGTT